MGRKPAKMFVTLLCVCAVALLGCAGGSSGNGSGNSPVALTAFSADVAKCTPQVQSSPKVVSGALLYNVMTISDWSGWNPATQYSILYNLLTQDSVEGMFDPIDKADMIINALNSLKSYWLTNGVYPNVTVPLEIAGTTATLNVTLTVDTGVKSVTVPFFRTTQAVDRMIRMVGTISRGGVSDTIDAQIAFATTSSGEALVVRTVFGSKGETSMFYGRKANGELDAWAACYVDEGTPGVSPEDFHVALKWHGNPSQKVFALTQIKASNLFEIKILAGGHADGDMAFLASNSGDAFDPTHGYYLVCTASTLNGTSPGPTVTIDTGLSADTSNAALDYIKTGNAACLGYLDAYPATAADVQEMP